MGPAILAMRKTRDSGVDLVMPPPGEVVYFSGRKVNLLSEHESSPPLSHAKTLLLLSPQKKNEKLCFFGWTFVEKCACES